LNRKEYLRKGNSMTSKKVIGFFTVLFVLLLQFSAAAQFETDTSQMRDPQFAATADQIVQDLTTRLTLTDEQSTEIKEILIDYQEEIQTQQGLADEAETRTDFETETQTETEFETETETDFDTETETDYETQTETDVTTGTEFNTQDQTGVVSGDPKERANQAIEQVLNDTQKTTWVVIRDAWWRDINSRYGWDKNTEGME
jgi:hypothetical protein